MIVADWFVLIIIEADHVLQLLFILDPDVKLKSVISVAENDPPAANHS